MSELNEVVSDKGFKENIFVRYVRYMSVISNQVPDQESSYLLPFFSPMAIISFLSTKSAK
jgi:hypothetical protein